MIEKILISLGLKQKRDVKFTSGIFYKQEIFKVEVAKDPYAINWEYQQYDWEKQEYVS